MALPESPITGLTVAILLKRINWNPKSEEASSDFREKQIRTLCFVLRHLVHTYSLRFDLLPPNWRLNTKLQFEFLTLIESTCQVCWGRTESVSVNLARQL